MSKKNTHPDQKYIEGLLQNNSFVIQAIYDKYVPKVLHYIANNSGDVDKAQDVVQEVLVTIYHQSKTENLKLTCPFDAYFFLLCKRRWLNELKKTNQKEVTIKEEVVSITDDMLLLAEEASLFAEKKALYDAMFEKLGKKCKELLLMAFKIKNMQKVAEKLGVSYAYVRKRKSLCIGQLTEMVQSSSAFKKIQNQQL
ncbi:sigma-70 family RNA polymerase sigma factor [Galbibacter sp. EGI 63066]|uniref:RNA polymerase sigma factor n=1 Tax=Galbibacter sp. EGI 63066 TaxID=2993559 RepID=UPI0022488125|nr:sigma-70 family RNA polymerase sigma factor [Galbibacter sp. EGI 63066]MCX2680336.1 sigma-70 family RNA polymerase sigma factor [Galbibacter sp. EGI 63066]